MRIDDLEFELYIPAEAIQERILHLAEELNKNFGDKNPLFIIVLNGAYIFAADLLRQFQGDNETAFTRIKSYTGTKSGEISAFSGIDENVNGRHVIFIEDIIDTGKTIYHLYQELDKYKPSSITTISLLQKDILRPYLGAADLYGFQIPDVFVVGFGLDYNEKGRNLKDIWKRV